MRLLGAWQSSFGRSTAFLAFAPSNTANIPSSPHQRNPFRARTRLTHGPPSTGYSEFAQEDGGLLLGGWASEEALGGTRERLAVLSCVFSRSPRREKERDSLSQPQQTTWRSGGLLCSFSLFLLLLAACSAATFLSDAAYCSTSTGGALSRLRFVLLSPFSWPS